MSLKEIQLQKYYIYCFPHIQYVYWNKVNALAVNTPFMHIWETPTWQADAGKAELWCDSSNIILEMKG